MRVWDASNGACLRTLNGHLRAVVAVAVAPDGRILSCGNDNTVRCWATTGGACTQAAPHQIVRQFASRARAASRADGCDLVLRGHSDGVCALAVLQSAPSGFVADAARTALSAGSAAPAAADDANKPQKQSARARLAQLTRKLSSITAFRSKTKSAALGEDSPSNAALKASRQVQLQSAASAPPSVEQALIVSGAGDARVRVAARRGY